MSSSEIREWGRQHYAGEGGRPNLYYFLFGVFSEMPPLSRSRYCSNGPPEGFELMKYGPGSHPEVLDEFRSGDLWETFRCEQPKLSESVLLATECFMFRGEIQDTSTLNYFRDAIGLMTYLWDNGGVALFDPWMLKWWDRNEWHERVFRDHSAYPRHHVVILVSEEDEPRRVWLHTRGMRKFGRPDISIHDVEVAKKDIYVDLIERFIELQAFGGVIAEGQEIRVRGIPDGYRCSHEGDPDDPDFNNCHVGIAR